MPDTDRLFAENEALRSRVKSLEEALHLAARPTPAAAAPLPGEALRRTILKSALDGYWENDAEGRIVEVNDAYCGMSGYRKDELLGMSVSTLEVVEPPHAANAHVARLKTRGEHRFETRHRRKDGSVFDVEANIGYRADAGGRWVGFFRDISVRKQAEEALRKSEEHTRLFIDTSQEGFGEVDANRRILTVNPRLEEMFGYGRGEMIGLAIEDLLFPEDRPKMAEHHARRQLGESQVYEQRFRRKDGATLWTIVAATPIRAENGRSVGAFAMMTDITDRKRAEEALRQVHDDLELRVAQRTRELQAEVAERRRAEEAIRASEERYRALFDGAAEGILIADGATRKFKYANPAICRMLGYPEPELVGMGVTEIHPAGSMDRVSSEFEALLTGKKTLVADLPCLRKDGTTIRVDLVSSPVTIDETPCLVGFFTDITVRKQGEEERRHLETKMQQVQRLESLGVLAGGIAHDFNNLLASILGNAELALDDVPTISPIRQNLEDIRVAAMSAADLCKQLLAYAGKGHFVLEPLDLSRIVEETRKILSISPAKKATLVFHLDRALPAIEADRSQLQQVAMNLILNAYEAFGDRGGSVDVSTGVTTCGRDELLACHGDPDPLLPGRYVYLEVADNGCGMDAATQGRMFEPFFTTKFLGRGLGLSAVLGIVKRQKGAIHVDSEVGRGTTIRVLFPTGLGGVEIPDATKAAPAEADRWEGTILVVDDEPTVLTMARRVLTRFGFKVLAAPGGKEALEVVARHPTGIDLVLLDLSMPDRDGVETFRQLQRIKPGIRVIVSSGFSEKECSQQFAGLSIAGYLEKPYRLETLRARLRAVLGGSGPGR